MAASGGYKPMRRGDSLTAKGVNQNIVGGSMRGVKLSGDVDKRQFKGGYSLDMPERGGISPWSAFMKWAEIVSVQEDYLTCKNYGTVTGDSSGSNFLVAKPFLLQQTPFDGQTITYIDGDEITYTADATDPEYKRNHDDGSDSADFVITPNYFIGEPIFILRIPTLAGSTTTDWVELGMGRYWARV